MDEALAIGSRTRAEIVDGVEQLVIRYRGSRVVKVFLCLWMTAWTAGCAAGFYGLTLAPDEPALLIFLAFLCLWMILWTAGCAAGFYGLTVAPDEPALLIFLAFLAISWLVVAAVTSWQLVGEEIVRIEGDHLIHAVRAPGWMRRHSYPVAGITQLSSDGGGPPRRRSSDNPPLRFGQSGVVRFEHCGRTVRLGIEQDEAEGRAILAWLAPRLPPASASS